MAKKLASSEFVGFLFVSSFAAFLNFGSRILFDFFFSFSISIFFAFLVGLSSAFYLNRIFVFKPETKDITKQFVYFTLVNLLALVQTLVISVLFEDYVLPYLGIQEYSKEISHLLGISFPIISSYYGHKYMTFKKR